MLCIHNDRRVRGDGVITSLQGQNRESPFHSITGFLVRLTFQSRLGMNTAACGCSRSQPAGNRRARPRMCRDTCVTFADPRFAEACSRSD